MDIKYSVKHNVFDKTILTEKDYDYIDPDNLSETIYRFEFPSHKPDENGDIMPNELYIALGNIIKMQYLLPMRYLKVNEDSFSYVAQKSNIIGDNLAIENATVQVEPLNPNFTKQLRYTHINQMIPIGTIFYIHAEIPYRYEGDKPGPFRKMLTSKSIKTDESKIAEKIIEESKKYGINNPITTICNKRIAFGAIDIGSRLDMKMSVEWTDIHESLTLFRFRIPEDNIIEFVVYDHFNVNMKYILNLMKNDTRLEILDDERKYLNTVIDDMLKAIV